MRPRALPAFGALAAALVITGACREETAAERVVRDGEGRLTTLVERKPSQLQVCLDAPWGDSMPPACVERESKESPRLEGPLAEKLAQEIPFRTALVDLTIRRKSEEVWELERFEVVDDFRDALRRFPTSEPTPGST